MKSSRPIVLLTGKPRAGKTTLVYNLARAFGSLVDGFVTLEVRNNNSRIGFDLLDLQTHEKQPLARKSWNTPYRVGSYRVKPENLDTLLIKLDARRVIPPGLWIIDELGKMEAFSKKFISWLDTHLSIPGVHAILTSGLRPPGVYMTILDRIHPDVLVLTPENRSSIEQLLKQRFAHLLVRHG